MFHSGPTWGTKDEERMGKLLYNCFKEAVNIFCRLPEWIRNVQMIPGFSKDLDENMDENLAWLTQKTEDPKM